MRTRPRALAALCLALLTLTGCWQEEPPEEDISLIPFGMEEPEEEEEEGPLPPERFALPYAPGEDPIDGGGGTGLAAASLMYEGLFRLDGGFEPQPCLCESYTRDESATRYVFTLRSGVLFSDGTPLTARDVKNALDRARSSDRYRNRLAAVSSVAAGNGSVTVTLTRPNTALPALLDVPIVKSGGLAGTGPYFLAEEETGDYLIANQSWWRGESQPVDRIPLVEARDESAALYRFSSREVQLMTADLTGVQAVSLTGGADCWDADTTLLQYVGCNTARAPLDSPALRRALWAGIDREEVAGAFLSGHGRAAAFPISPASALYPADLEEPAPAEDLTPPEEPLTLLVNQENSFKAAIASYLAETWTAGGVAVEVRALPWEEYAAALAGGDFDLYYGETRLTADWDLRALLEPGGALNYGRWSHPDTSRYMGELAGAEDRAAAARALCAHLREQAPILPVCFKSVSALTQAGVVENLTPTAAEPFYNLGQCAIHLREE